MFVAFNCILKNHKPLRLYLTDPKKIVHEFCWLVSFNLVDLKVNLFRYLHLLVQLCLILWKRKEHRIAAVKIYVLDCIEEHVIVAYDRALFLFQFHCSILKLLILLNVLNRPGMVATCGNMNNLLGKRDLCEIGSWVKVWVSELAELRRACCENFTIVCECNRVILS